jgi:small subunit ribosomal protein S15
MSLSAEKKQPVIKKLQRSANDTGSPEVQISILTEEINLLSAHMGTHPKDVHSRRGLIGKVNNRNRLLKYLKKAEPLRR